MASPNAHADKRRKWRHEDNRELIICWVLSNPNQRGFRKRLLSLWSQRNPDKPTTEQLLAGQLRAIQQRKEFSELEIEEIRSELRLPGAGHQSGASSEDQSGPALLTVPDKGTQLNTSTVSEEQLTGQPSTDDNQVPSELKPLLDKVIRYMQQSTVPNGIHLPVLKSVKWSRLMRTVAIVNEVCQYVQTSSLQATIDLLFAAARTTVEELGMTCKSEPSSQRDNPVSVPPWKRRLINKLQGLRKDLSRLVALNQGELHNQCTVEHLHNKYLQGRTSLTVAIEILKQKVLACSSKIRRYTSRIQGFHDNKLFRVDQRRFYKDLCSSGGHDNVVQDHSPDFMDQTVQFWKQLWDDSKQHNSQATWISKVATKLQDITAQQPVTVTSERWQ